jgi:hypothetical protein
MTFSSHVTIQNVDSGAIINFGNYARIAPTIINREIAVLEKTTNLQQTFF